MKDKDNNIDELKELYDLLSHLSSIIGNKDSFMSMFDKMMSKMIRNTKINAEVISGNVGRIELSGNPLGIAFLIAQIIQIIEEKYEFPHEDIMHLIQSNYKFLNNLNAVNVFESEKDNFTPEMLNVIEELLKNPNKKGEIDKILKDVYGDKDDK